MILPNPLTHHKIIGNRIKHIGKKLQINTYFTEICFCPGGSICFDEEILKGKISYRLKNRNTFFMNNVSSKSLIVKDILVSTFKPYENELSLNIKLGIKTLYKFYIITAGDD